jgi:hypothetical protein
MSTGKAFISETLQTAGLTLEKRTIKKPMEIAGVMRNTSQRVFVCNEIESDSREADEPGNITQQDDLPQPQTAGDATLSAKIETTAKKPANPEEPQWQTDFRTEVEQAIAGLSQLGYIRGGNILPLLSSRSNGATEKFLEGMRKDEILSKTKFREKDVRAADLVTFSVFRNNRSLFRNPEQKAICEQIVRASISRHMAEEEKRKIAEAQGLV